MKYNKLLARTDKLKIIFYVRLLQLSEACESSATSCDYRLEQSYAKELGSTNAAGDQGVDLEQ